MKRLMLVRHGESEWNAGRRLQGQADIDLSPRGEKQAEALRATVAALSPDRAVTSSLRRARRTAALLGFPGAEESDGLREIDVGAWSGEWVADIVARDGELYQAWRAGRHTPPGGEAWGAFKARTQAIVRTLLDGEASRILIVSHGGVLRALLETFLALPPQRIVPVGPGSLTVLRQDAESRAELRLELFNFSPGGPIFDAPD
jgi:glucosyl-3-phosphoglycerate phosphatase